MLKTINFKYTSCKYFVRFKTTTKESQQYDDYQFLHKSDLPSSLFQSSLPRLPIPQLTDTVAKYLNSVKPILTASEYENTQRLAQEFLKKEGPLLQNILVQLDKQNKQTSYISEMWFNMYLSDRASLPINFNPGLIFIDEPKPTNQLNRATNLLISSLRFRRSLNENVLYPEVYFINQKTKESEVYKKTVTLLPNPLKTYGSYLFKAYPLDMSQYNRLFQTTRIPKLSKDEIFNFKENVKHVVVLRHGVFYNVDVLDNSGDILPSNVIQASLHHILTKPPKEQTSISAFTTSNRDYWAGIREHLIKSGNLESLKVIDSALFILCLDDETLTDPIQTIRNFLFENHKNRWFDKSFSLIVNKDAQAGVNFEHTWGDGVAVLRYFNEVYKDSVEKPQVNGEYKISNVDVRKYVKKIDFVVDDFIEVEANNAFNTYLETSNSVDVNTLESRTFGRSLCRKHKISPDFVMQVAFQLAYYKMTGRFEAVYESCSTSAFKHGRTETMRPLTSDTKKFCEAVLKKSNNISNIDLYNMMKNCSNNHIELTKNAAMGKGFDRHLFALKNMAEKNGLQIPEFYKDVAYSRVNGNILSTSTLNSDTVFAGGFGPVKKDGFGIGYTILNNYLGSAVSSYKSHNNGKDFIDCIQSAINEIHTILLSQKI